MLEQTTHIPGATAEQVYEVLLSSEEHAKLIGDEAKISNEVNGTFSTFSGYADGKNLELVPGKKIVQTWRASDWPGRHYSTITFELEDTDSGTKINFTQENIPTGREEEFETGWQDHYWEPLRDYFS